MNDTQNIPKLNADTQLHIDTVRRMLRLFANELVARGETHDQSKFAPEEADVFDEYSPKLSKCTYGSPEYKSFLAAMKPALEHHYANNRHHPEHFTDSGISGMNLLDVCEMFLDWLAASRRHDDGNIHRSIRSNERRFNLSSQLAQIFHNTAADLGETLEIRNQFEGCCKTCAKGLFPDGTGVQCWYTSAPMFNHDGCEKWEPTG